MIRYDYALVRDVLPHTSTDFVLVKSGIKSSCRSVVNIKGGKTSYTSRVRGQPTVFVRDGNSIILRCGVRFYSLQSRTKQITTSGRKAFYSVFDSGTLLLREFNVSSFVLRNSHRVELYPHKTQYIVRKGSGHWEHLISLPVDPEIREADTRRGIVFNISENRLLTMSTLVSRLSTHRFYLRRQLAHYYLEEQEDGLNACLTEVYSAKICLPKSDHGIRPEILAGAVRPITDGRIGWVDYVVDPDADADAGQLVIVAADKSNAEIQRWLIEKPPSAVKRSRQLAQLYYFDAQDDLLAWCADDMLIVQDSYSERMRVIPEEGVSLRGCRVSPDQQTVWCWSSDCLYVWDVE